MRAFCSRWLYFIEIVRGDVWLLFLVWVEVVREDDGHADCDKPIVYLGELSCFVHGSKLQPLWSWREIRAFRDNRFGKCLEESKSDVGRQSSRVFEWRMVVIVKFWLKLSWFVIGCRNMNDVTYTTILIEYYIAWSIIIRYDILFYVNLRVHRYTYKNILTVINNVESVVIPSF